MSGAVKVGLVAAGYIGAGLVAAAVVAVYAVLTDGPDRQASSGMYAFGDSLLFLAVFGLASIPATGTAFFFLRSRRSFWRPFVAGALAVAATGLVALVEFVAAHGSNAGPVLGRWSVLAVFRIILAPLFGLTFFISGVFAPRWAVRIALFGATLIEAVVFGWVAVTLIYAKR